MNRSREAVYAARLAGVDVSALEPAGVGESGVARWRAPSVGVWCRVHRDRRRYMAERSAYERMRAAVMARVPQLVAFDDACLALVVSHVEGVVPLPSQVDPDALTELIGRLRTVPPLHNALSMAEAFERRRDAVAARLDPIDMAAAAVVRSLGKIADVDRVFCHRDLTVRNMLLADGELGLVDFEHAQDDAPEMELLRIELDAPNVAHRVGLRLCDTDESRHRLDALRVLERGRELVWATAHADAARAEDARRFLGERQRSGVPVSSDTRS